MSDLAFVVDFASGALTLGFESPHETTLPLPAQLAALETNIDRVALYPARRVALVGLPDGTQAAVELRGHLTAEQALAGRQVVYLDQNKWSDLDRFRRGASMRAGEADAAERLLAMVDERRVVLPASAAHYVETSPLYGDKRVALAATVLSGSRGWQMRNPLHVRVEELARDLNGQAPVAVDVFAPQAPDVFGPPSAESSADDRLPPPFDTLSRDMPTVLSIVEVLVDRVAVPDEGGAARAAAWAKDHADFAKWMRDERLGPERAGRAVLGKLLADLTPEIMHLARNMGRDPREIVDRYLGRDDPLSRLPSVARARGILHGRLRNATQRWEANDLIDIVNLACAAGYADVVVGERQNISYLRQARNVPPGALLATSLAEGVALLESG